MTGRKGYHGKLSRPVHVLWLGKYIEIEARNNHWRVNTCFHERTNQSVLFPIEKQVGPIVQVHWQTNCLRK